MVGTVLKRGLQSFFCFVLLFAGLPVGPAAAQTTTIREGNDYATQVFRDPWDMNEFSDISQYLNNSGQNVYIQNIQVANGIFSAQSATADPQFTALFPGYQTAMLIGKVGHNFPIQSSVYKCFYIDLLSSVRKADNLEVYWFKDERLNGGVWGHTAKQITPTAEWALYKIDLSTTQSLGTSWTSSSTWQGLRVDPSVNLANFSIDWIRLTDCSPVDFNVPGMPGGKTAKFYLNKNGHDTFIKQITSDDTKVDVQGIEAGTYTYKAVDAGSGALLTSGKLTINQAPIATFTRPSPSSGSDYAKSSGTSWNMANSAGVSSVECMIYSFSGGMLNLATNDHACASGGYADPKIFLNAPKPASTGLYRYLSMKIYADGPWQNIPDGMITRLVWSIQGTGGGGSVCYLVSQDIPYDVGWHTYSIDLYDAFNGSIEQKTAGCPGSVTSWQNSGTVIGFRFDPNENQLGRTLNQKIEWVRLTAMDRVSRGSKFPVSLLLNKAPGAISSYKFYYTTSPGAPTQHPANGSIDSLPNPSPSPRGPHTLFLPSVLSNVYSSVAQNLVFNWDTNRVNPGQYYLCVNFK